MLKILSKDFKLNTPVLPNVKILEPWGYYDGPLFGICEILGKQFFFIDLVYDIWRYYDDNTHDRLWSIFGAYDIDINYANELIAKEPLRATWENTIREESNCIGIFWEYKL